MTLVTILFALLLAMPVDARAQAGGSPELTENAAWALPDRDPVLTYFPGRGLHLSPADLTLGGYLNVSAGRNEGGAARLALDELSAFVSWQPIPQLELFSETELEDVVEWHSEGGSGSDIELRLERLYADYHRSDEVNLRFGKFLTPVGRWNLIHASPLVWTTSRPLVTERPFDQHATGAMAFGRFFPPWARLSYSVFGQATDQLAPVRQPRDADRQVGARLEAARGQLALGTSFVAQRERDQWQELGGADLEWAGDWGQLLGEAIIDGSSDRADLEWGLYLQSAVRVRGPWFAVLRYEHFSPAGPKTALNLVTIAGAFRPFPFLVAKLEYMIADHANDMSPPGIRGSLAVLF